VGGEWNADSLAEQQAVARMLPLGRNSAVNAECSDDPRSVSGVRIGYALGQRYYTPYNYPLGSMDVATAALRDVSQPLEPFVHQPALLEHDFASKDAWKQAGAGHDGIEVGRIGNTPVNGAFPASQTKAGTLRYRVKPARGAFDSLAVELFGRAFDFARANERIGIRVRVDGESAGEVAAEQDLNDVRRIDLTAAARGKGEVEVAIELDAGGAEMRQWCSLWRVRFTTAWPEVLTANLPRQDRSLKTTRRRSLLVSWRRDAELALAASATPEARQAYARGEYAEAYRLANRSACTALPARYFVAENGRLAPYPVRVGTDRKLEIELLECSAERVRLTATEASEGAAGGGAVAMEVGELRPGAAYAVESTPDGGWSLHQREDGPLRADALGNVSFTIEPRPAADSPPGGDQPRRQKARRDSSPGAGPAQQNPAAGGEVERDDASLGDGRR
jgi:hypothetical protein